MQYDGTGKLVDALAALYGYSPRSHNKIAELIAEAKAGLGMTHKARNLPTADRLAIYRWHYNRLNPVQDGKQDELGDTGSVQAVDFSTEKKRRSVGIPPESPVNEQRHKGIIDNDKPPDEAQTTTPAKPVQNVKRVSPVYNVKHNAPAQFNGNNSHLNIDDYHQIHFAVTINQQKQPKRTTVMLEGYLVKALQRKHGLPDNTAIRVWIEQAIRRDGVRFNTDAPLTKQIKRIVIESFA